MKLVLKFACENDKIIAQTHKHTTVNNKRPVNVLMAQAHFNYRGNSNLRNVFADFIVSQDLSYIYVYVFRTSR